MTLPPNAPGCHYPIPRAGDQDWLTLARMFRGMAADAQLRADDLQRPTDMRAASQATAGAYTFAALMIEVTYYPAP